MVYSISKRLLLFLLTLSFLITLTCPGSLIISAANISGIKPYDDVRGKDLSAYDFNNSLSLLKTLTFDTKTFWPSRNKMPPEFDPKAVMETGKNPGLGIRELQAQGYTGKGVTVGYVDQFILKEHSAYSNVDLNYTRLDVAGSNEQSSMHGPAVLSLLAGRDIGIIPDAKVYFWGHNGGSDDNKYEAEAFENAVILNRTLPNNRKIKIMGMSHTAITGGNYPEYADRLRKAEKAARDSGIIVVDVTFDMATCGSMPNNNKEDYSSYQISNWEDSRYTVNRLFVPADFRTTAVGHEDDPEHYAYWGESGFSWGVPYIVGVIAMGLQVNPSLTEKEAISYLFESGNDFLNGKIINPKGFIELVRKNCANPRDISLDKDYRYFLYNKNRVTDDDLKSINTYVSSFASAQASVLIDVSTYQSASDIYNYLKKDFETRNGKLLGIQIIGTAEDVPSFDVQYKIKYLNGIDSGGSFKSDNFYSNFNSENVYDGISIYEIFDKNLNVDFVPQWPVARLLVTKGEISRYMDKYFDYVQKDGQKSNNSIPLVDFSSPIFPSALHSDDTGILLNRMSTDFKIINRSSYRLYGNLQGLYPVSTEVLGDFSGQSMSAENKLGFRNFSINSHGQSNNIDQYLVAKSEDLSKYPNKRGEVSLDKDKTEFRQSLVNSENINNVLSDNYYTIFFRSCLSAYALSSNNLIHKALAEGKMISGIANTSVGSNNGMDVYASLSDLKYNNPAYNYMIYAYSLLSGNTVSDSFFKAKAAYSTEILKHKVIAKDHGNYQYQLHNVLSQSYLGLLETKAGMNVTLDSMLNNCESKSKLEGNEFVYEDAKYQIPVIKSSQKAFAVFKDDGYIYGKIPTPTKFETPGYILKELSAATDADHVYIKVKYVSPEKKPVYFHLAWDAPGLKELYRDKTIKGQNIFIAKFDKKQLAQFTQSVAIFVGDTNHITLPKELVQLLSKVRADERLLTSIGVRLNGKLIPFDSKTGYPYRDKNKNVLVPFYTLIQSIGAEKVMNEEKNMISAIKGNVMVDIILGEKAIYINGKKLAGTTAAVVQKGIIYTPVSDIIKAFGYKANWDQGTETMILSQ